MSGRFKKGEKAKGSAVLVRSCLPISSLEKWVYASWRDWKLLSLGKLFVVSCMNLWNQNQSLPFPSVVLVVSFF